MKFSQRQIIEVPFNLPQGAMNHPALILSSNECIELERAFIAVMITSEKMDDEFSFELTNSMPESGKLTSHYSEIRLHLISFFKFDHVIPNYHLNTKVKKEYFTRILKQIMRISFGQDM